MIFPAVILVGIFDMIITSTIPRAFLSGRRYHSSSQDAMATFSACRWIYHHVAMATKFIFIKFISFGISRILQRSLCFFHDIFIKIFIKLILACNSNFYRIYVNLNIILISNNLKINYSNYGTFYCYC